MEPTRVLALAACASMLACGRDDASSGVVAADGGVDATADSPADVSLEVGNEGAADAPAVASEAGDAGPAQAIAIPMYMDPGASPADWSQETSAAPTVALLVANPNSGPGTAEQTEYTQAIGTAHTALQSVVGYVHTSYGARAIAQVEADVDAWYSFYPSIDGIFYDEVSSDATTIPGYYEPIFGYVKAKPAGPRNVVINPGTIVDQTFMQVADIVVTFEDTYAHYTDGSYPPNPAWMAGYPRWRFWHLVLSATTASDMQNAVTIARGRNVGYVYVTDQPPATAYSQLVTGYWHAELSAVQAP
jgi:hypothetical protein